MPALFREKLATPDVTMANHWRRRSIRARGGRDLSDNSPSTTAFSAPNRGHLCRQRIARLREIKRPLQHHAGSDIQIRAPLRSARRTLVFTESRGTRARKNITPLKDRSARDSTPIRQRRRRNDITARKPGRRDSGKKSKSRLSPPVVEKSPSRRAKKRVDRRSGVSQRFPIHLRKLVSSAEQRPLVR